MLLMIALAVTMGDPAGIGPEVVLKALADRTLQATIAITLVGTRSPVSE
jgi:4-hydroxythreonine-4-phosphate dehydrogenase